MREQLLGYDFTIYDTCCVVSLCFCTEEKSVNGEPVTIDEPPFTELAQSLTAFLRQNKKKIRTIRTAFDEAHDDCLDKIIRKRICDKDLRTRLGLARGDSFPPDIQLKMFKRLRRNVRRLEGKNWFLIDDVAPDSSRISRIRNFLRGLAPDASWGSPSDPDIMLLMYSQDEQVPVVSNDHHLTDFSSDLEANGHAHKVVHLKDTAT